MKRIIKRIVNLFPKSYCLMFHHIDNGNIAYNSKCILSLDAFVDFLDSGLEFVSIKEHLSFSKHSKNKCAITFDDGLKDIYTVAYPELKKRNIPFTVFIIVDYLNKDGYLTSDELLTLSKDPLVTIASHGMTHDVLKGLSREKQEYELCESKKALERLTNCPIDYFAYSHGGFDETTLNILKNTKLYRFAFGVARSTTNIITKRRQYFLPRINLENGEIPTIIKKHNKVQLIIK